MTKTDNSNELVANLFATMRYVRERSQKRQKRDPFSALQLETLNYVAGKGKPTMKDVSNYLCVAPPSATSMVNGLVSVGKLERITDSEDRRIVRLTVTAKGKREAEKWYNEKTQRIKKVFSVLSEKEREDLIRILAKISRPNDNTINQ